MNLFSLEGQVAIITGSSRGIGRAIALRMAEHGAKVVVSSRKVAACEEVVKTIQDKYGKDRAVAIAANISSKDDLANLVAETERHWGQVNVLVCNAASNPYYGPQAGIADEQFRKILDNNIVANHWLINLVAPKMIQRKAGSIIIVSSIGGLRGSPVIGAYCLLHQQSRRYATRPQLGCRIWSAQCAGQLHCPRFDQNRLCPRIVGRRSHAERAHGDDTA